jgi:hypothetical protein
MTPSRYAPNFAALAKAEAMRKVAEAHVEELHVAVGKLANAVEDRNEAIREAWLDGVPAKTIAEAVGLSRQRIYQLCADLPVTTSARND